MAENKNKHEIFSLLSLAITCLKYNWLIIHHITVTVLSGSGCTGFTHPTKECLQDGQELVLDFVWMLNISTDGQVVAIISQKRVYVFFSKQSCEDS